MTNSLFVTRLCRVEAAGTQTVCDVTAAAAPPVQVFCQCPRCVSDSRPARSCECFWNVMVKELLVVSVDHDCVTRSAGPNWRLTKTLYVPR